MGYMCKLSEHSLQHNTLITCLSFPPQVISFPCLIHALGEIMSTVHEQVEFESPLKPPESGLGNWSPTYNPVSDIGRRADGGKTDSRIREHLLGCLLGCHRFTPRSRDLGRPRANDRTPQLYSSISSGGLDGSRAFHAVHIPFAQL